VQLRALWFGSLAGSGRSGQIAERESESERCFSIEIEDNLTTLDTYLSNVESRINFTSSPMANMQKGDALSSVPLTEFSHRIWESLTPSVPMV
jgi:hypothetical protein